MKFMNDWWGIQENITPLEIAARSAVMFIIALLMIRAAGMRPFAQGESFDRIIVFLIGAILSRGVVGATPFFSTVASMIVIIAIHKILSKLSLYNHWFGEKVKGKSIILFDEGKFVEKHLQKCNLSHHDVEEELHKQCNCDSFSNIKQVYMERTGEISFIKKDEE
jgi:uncharacterized membrane protein YcaP (DUF421 family)